MSIVTHKRTIVPAIWPGQLGRASSGAFDLQVRDDWRYVPESFEGVCDWATLTNDDDDEGTRALGPRHLVYRPSVLPEERRDTPQVVVVVLQGFLGDFNIAPLGNWGRDMNASAAMQYLTLESGGESVAFPAQVRALRDLREFITAKAGLQFGEVEEQESRIVLERPVFTKVRPNVVQRPAVRLTDATDPGGRARKIAAQWRVDHVIQTAIRRMGGQNMEVAYTSLRRGDFVEVSAYADIRVVRREKRLGTIIRFAMTEVVRLWTAADAKLHFQRTDVVASGGERRSASRVVTVPSIFNIQGADSFAEGSSKDGEMEVE